MNAQDAYKQAYEIAMRKDKPFLRFCVDLSINPKVSPQRYAEIRRFAKRVVTFSDGRERAFFIGPYAKELRAQAERTLHERNFPYSFAKLDGVVDDGRVNLALWLQKEDIQKAPPRVVQRVFRGGISKFYLLQRATRFEDVHPTYKRLAEQFRMRTPIAAKVVYSYPPGDRGLDGFIVLPPVATGFYGGEASPAEHQKMIDDAESGENFDVNGAIEEHERILLLERLIKQIGAVARGLG